MALANRYQSAEQRFAAQHMPVSESGCWLWIGSINAHGYGGMRANEKTYAAHRYSWERKFGAIPAGAHVCHKCDTPSCVNPDHLFLGSNRDNVADRENKGRGPQAERHPRARLSDLDVAAIRTSQDRRRAIAARYGISIHYVKALRSGKAKRAENV